MDALWSRPGMTAIATKNGGDKRKKPAAVATGFTEFQRSYFPS